MFLNMTYAPEFTLPPIDWRPPADGHDQASSASPVEAFRDAFPGRRRNMRHLTCDPVQVQSICGASMRQEGLALDVSERGLMLELQRPLSRQMTIEVSFPGSALIVFGEVTYCRAGEAGYRAGVHIHDIAIGSRNERHLEDDDLFLYLGGAHLTSAEVIGFQHHLNGCRVCAARLDDTRQVMDRMRARAARTSGAPD